MLDKVFIVLMNLKRPLFLKQDSVGTCEPGMVSILNRFRLINQAFDI